MFTAGYKKVLTSFPLYNNCVVGDLFVVVVFLNLGMWVLCSNIWLKNKQTKNPKPNQNIRLAKPFTKWGVKLYDSSFIWSLWKTLAIYLFTTACRTTLISIKYHIA